jgi:hypothetical protein
MSVLGPDIHQAVSQLLSGLQSSDNVLRSAAEDSLNNEWVVPRPEILLMALAEQITGADDVGTRNFAAVIFRRVAIKTRKVGNSQNSQLKDLFITLKEPERNAIQAKLLQALASESTPSVRNKVSDAVAELARQYTEEGMSF